MHSLPWPDGISVADFDALHDQPAAWHGELQAMGAQLGARRVQPMDAGTVLVALLDDDRVLKLYPPFLHDHFAFERAALQHLAGRLPVPTPVLLDSGAAHGRTARQPQARGDGPGDGNDHSGGNPAANTGGAWPWLLMTQLPGQPLTAVWPGLGPAQRCRLLRQLGELAGAAHALGAGDMARHAPPWQAFIAGQRQRCAARQQRTGLPPHLLAQLSGFLDGPLPEGPPVMLTGEYTPFNLMADADGSGCLVGMFDFGDGLVGPAAYDWLGPLCFLCAGDAERCAAFLAGLGVVMDAGLRLQLLRLLLLHRYSHLPAQLACPGWQDEPSFEALAARLWPLAGG
jgi:hygromycin-B 7''-O-kinase